MKYNFIEAERGNFQVRACCRVLGVSERGFYDRQRRRDAPDRRIPSNEDEVRAAILRIHRRSRGRYGRPRLAATLRREGFRVGGKRIRRIMRELGIEGRSGRKRKKTAKPAHAPPAPNLLARNFTVIAPNTVWAGDITETRVGRTKLYLAVVVDLHSRLVVGWALARSASAALVVEAMKRAVRRRRPPRGLIFHSDQGAQYRSKRFRDQLRVLGIRQSMSRRGNCWDNAPIESFFSTVKQELISERRWESPRQLELALDRYVRFYNRERIHSALGYLSPLDYEGASKTA